MLKKTLVEEGKQEIVRAQKVSAQFLRNRAAEIGIAYKELQERKSTLIETILREFLD